MSEPMTDGEIESIFLAAVEAGPSTNEKIFADFCLRLVEEVKRLRKKEEPLINSINKVWGKEKAPISELPTKDYKNPPPVDRSKQTTLHGTPIGEHLKIGPDGMQKDYIVLTQEERSKGFVRPVRRSYKHLKCGVVTTMGISLAETYARDPKFYTGTFCCGCGKHLPVGEDGEFIWDGSSEKVGT